MDNTSKPILVYITGYDLHHASKSLKQRIDYLAEYLVSVKKVRILHPIVVEKSFYTDIQKNKIELIKSAGLIIAECTYHSIDLGMDLGAAIYGYQKPVLAIARADAKSIAPSVIGASCEDNPNVTFRKYGSDPELWGICSQKIDQIRYS